MAVLPCFLCGKELEERTDKNQKPYFVCDPCGTQVFIRRKQGIENLRHLMRTLRGRDLHLREHAATLFEIRAILQEIDGIQGEMKKLDSFTGLFSKNKEKTRASKILHKRLRILLGSLEHIAEGGEET
jgi:DNA-directed RNA polymerase subunit RPC12/RpoP